MNTVNRTSANREENLNAFVVGELASLRGSEKQLTDLYAKLPDRPRLRETFVRQLAAVALRAERLNAVLNNLDLNAVELPKMAFLAPSGRPAA